MEQVQLELERKQNIKMADAAADGEQKRRTSIKQT